MRQLSYFLFLLAATISLQAQEAGKAKPPDSWITRSLADSGTYILETKDYTVWGCAPIYDDDGKVHVYFSTWENGAYWLTDSKIAHAVADHPEGPYEVLGTILEGRGEGYWDAHTIHNPSIYRVDGKYVMLYIGNDTTQQETWRDRAHAANTQRVGMAIADSPYGPWKRFDKPMIEVSEDSMAWDGYCTVNPAFLQHPNGEYWIYYRAWDRRNDDRRKTGVAMSKKLEGPYLKYEGNPIIDFPEYGGQTEDPYFFYYRGKFHCLIRDMGNFDWYSNLYLESEDGLNWGPYQRGHHKGSFYFPVSEKSRYERVQVLFKDGEPEYLFNSIQRQDGYRSGAVLKMTPPPALEHPNVIVVLADDIGLGDISYYRSRHSDKIILETPHIDKLALEGMAFTHAHAPAALCAPSRYGIMTGNSCFRSPFPWGVWGAYEKSPIEADQLTLGKLMKQAGYHTAFFGKWHLGGDYFRKDKPGVIYRAPRNKPEVDVNITRIVSGGPKEKGFDYSLTFPAGIQNVPYAVYENEEWMPLEEDSEIGYISQENMTKIGVKLDKSEGLGDLNWDPHDMGPLLTQKAVDYIHTHAHQKGPFFMYYCSQAVHLPHTPPEELNGVAIAETTPTRHMDMIRELDVQMGMLVDALKEQGIYENTLFIFTSDNGGLTRRETLKSGHRPSDIYRGGKNTPYEGGHRVPFIASWPGVIKSGQVSGELALGLDVMATLASLTGQKLPEDQAMDSHDLMPLLLNREGAGGHPYLMVQGGTGKEVILIQDGWKLIIQVDKADRSDKTRAPLALFNLEKNPGELEEQNLIHSEAHQDLVHKMFTKYNELRDKD